MKAKKVLSLLSLALLPLFLYANDDIPLWQGNVPTPGDPTDPRSIENVVTASIDGRVVTVSFNNLTTSHIVVIDSNNQTVFNQTYSASYSVQADLLSIPLGNYTIYIYAYGYCWVGVFSIE